MIVIKILLCLLFIALAPGTAAAQEKKTIPLTAIRGGQDGPSAGLQLRRLDGNGENAARSGEDPAAAAAKRVWEKYKALAAGTYEEPSDKDKNKSKAEQQPTPATQAEETQKTEPAPATGIGGILQQYQRNKTTGGQMRTLVVTPPAQPEAPDKPQP